MTETRSILPAPQRIGPLAKLPVFLDLQGRRVVVVGDTPAAAWKAELLAAAGADVVCIARGWRAEDLTGATLVVIDAADAAEAAAFRAAAKAAGAICSAIDKPDHCDVQFGAIVNRSPVVIGISTDGAAPILAQAIRRRIETLLPASLGAWASVAKRIRKKMAERLPAGGLRRAFWERFAERAFIEPTVPTDIEIAPMKSAGGHVTLVGAGPGDAELLTLKAMRALQSADVILFDDLVSDEVLELARREARRMMVGKRGGRVSCQQEDINALMIKLARQGKRVVRLKSGDPMVFGRAGEEIAALESAGIPVAVVPGITAALAAASSLGVSLTHRDTAHSVRFVTGHSRQGALPDDLDWRGLADAETSLMVYMGGRTGGAFAARLMREGLPASTPVVAVSAVSRRDEVRWTGLLSELGDALLRMGVEQPVLVGIGQVFATARVAAGSIEKVA
ncbi:siroheme synthase CysG [Ferrovibrio sp.]|uniref:siroheme synthase CysG n=1 Tax=Ferrovibrio sp. TaxID=1917215 RepID=UPI000CB98A50|nr:siroheme synthase CysG [Ferrovibrio sp.]PJI43376.1 MAG: uroporphyrinogen-III C-methyltransferase [Ferrovibrio sp.]